jgi:hypothetical protein
MFMLVSAASCVANGRPLELREPASRQPLIEEVFEEREFPRITAPQAKQSQFEAAD